MKPYGRRLVLPLDFEETVGALSRALRDEGFDIIGRIDVRDQCRQALGRPFPLYVLLEAWSPEFAFAALRQDPDRGPLLPVTFAVYDAAPQETVVLCSGFRRTHLGITQAVDQELARIARVFHRLAQEGQGHPERSAA